jgi:hypothetical protein
MPDASRKSLLRYIAEVLIVAPMLALAVTWIVLIVAGLLHLYDLQTHVGQISALLLLLAGAVFVCFVAGVLLFAIASIVRRR